MCVCVCNQSLGCVIWPNYEVVEFQPRSWITTALYSVAYWCVPLPFLSCYYSPHLTRHTRSFSHQVVNRLHPRISTYRKRSSSHLSVAHICTSILTSRSYNFLFPWLLLCGSLTPSLPPCLTQDFFQIFLKLLLSRLLAPPFVPPESSHLVALLSCTQFKYWPQLHPLFHGYFSSSYVGHFQLIH